MKKTVINFLLALLLATPIAGWAQGSLTPSGPPGPTMKSLSQVEPRTLISSLPFTISSSGSYYLAASLTGVAGQNGIVISAGNVTFDLRGFELTGGGGGAGCGVLVSGGVTNVAVLNGSANNWASNGIDVSAGLAAVLKDLRADANTGDGLRAGGSCLVSGCTASANAGDGILVASSCVVTGDVAATNGAAAAGIHAQGSQNRFEGNHAIGNGSGIQVDGINNLVIRNSAEGSLVQDYNLASGNNYGQILTSPGAGFVNLNNWANFSGACASIQTVCSGVCVNLTNDPANCGSCGAACGSGLSCVNGSCTLVCPSGLTNCAGTCVNLANANANCGSCGNACPAGQVCSSGSCQLSCQAGLANCSGLCANFQEDNQNCGGCGHVCAAGQICSAGSCVVSCQAGLANCSGSCVNESVDTSHCGTCTTVCASGQSCVSGTCECPPGQINCSGACTAINVDSSNCGSCGHVCAAGSVCSGGACAVSCQSGLTNCSGLCVNETEDNNHCGGCSTVCATSTQKCISGACLLTSGQTCSTGTQCASGTCSSSKCL